jgi:hypothetical protein
MAQLFGCRAVADAAPILCTADMSLIGKMLQETQNPLAQSFTGTLTVVRAIIAIAAMMPEAVMVLFRRFLV